MKNIRIVVTLLLCVVIMFIATSCRVIVLKDNGHHKGWSKNSNNSHSPGNKGKSKN